MKTSYRNQVRLALLALPMLMPEQIKPSMSYMGKLTVAGNIFGPFKPHISGMKMVEIDGAKVASFKKEEMGETETEPEGFLQALDIELGGFAFFQLNETFSLGGGLGVGFSASREKAKTWKSLTINESFIFKLGIAAKITDWVMISAGFRLSQLGFEVNWTEEEKKLADDTPFKYDVNKALSGSNFVPGWYGDFNVLIPITENIRFIGTIGIFGSMDTEFRVKSYKSTTAGAVAPDGAGGGAPVSADRYTEQEDKVNLTKRMGIRIGVGAAFEF